MATVASKVETSYITPSEDGIADVEAEEMPSEPNALLMDAGIIAWLQVLGSWILYANSWGVSGSYGVFQSYYTTTMLPDHSASSIAWIGSIQLFLTELLGGLVGYLIDAGFLRHILLTGTVLEVFGLMMLSLCHRYWQILLAQALVTGAGMGLLGLTCVAVTPLYFRRRRMLVMGIAATGSSVAGILYPLMLRHLLDHVGFAWAVRIWAFVILATMLICIVVMKDRPQLRDRNKKPSIFDMRHLRDSPYVLFSLGYCLTMATFFGPLFFVDMYGLRLDLTQDLATGLISIINATSLIGRLLPGWLADKVGGMNVILPCTFSTGVLLLFFRFAHDSAGLIVVCALYGLLSGALIAIVPAILANLTDDLAEVATRIGMAVTAASVFCLVGYPISAAAQRPQSDVQAEFQGTWFFAGAVMLVAFVAMAAAKHLKHGLFAKEVN